MLDGRAQDLNAEEVEYIRAGIDNRKLEKQAIEAGLARDRSRNKRLNMAATVGILLIAVAGLIVLYLYARPAAQQGEKTCRHCRAVKNRVALHNRAERSGRARIAQSFAHGSGGGDLATGACAAAAHVEKFPGRLKIH